jgi:hypothetical protein
MQPLLPVIPASECETLPPWGYGPAAQARRMAAREFAGNIRFRITSPALKGKYSEALLN